MRFHELSEYAVILRSKGIYKQAKVYVYDNGYYAAYGSGFIRLHRNGTSVPNISVLNHDIPKEDFRFDKLDKMETSIAKRATDAYMEASPNYNRDTIVVLNPNYKANA